MLRQTLACLDAQRPNAHFFQTVVIDDASTDGTGDFLREYQGELDLKTIINPRNLGRSKTRNIGVQAADGELLLFIDGDMRFDPDLVLGHVRRHQEGELIILGRVVYDRSLSCRSYCRYAETRGASKLPPGTALPGRYFWSGHVSMPRRLFEAVGGFDENFSVHGGEDLDLGMRLHKAGCRMILAPELVAEHLHVRSLPEVLSTAREYGRGSIPLLIQKHPELIDQLKLNWASGSGARATVRRLMLTRSFFWFARQLAIVFNGLALPDFVYDYLIFRSYQAGYIETKGKAG